jgi:hypothetical protein
MDLKVLSGTANLAFPAIALQYLFSQLVIRFPIHPEARLLGANPVHEAFAVTSCRKACLWSPGKNLKNLEMDCSSTVGRRDKSRGYCLEMICADFLAGANLENVPSINAAVSMACSTTGICVLYSLK